MNNFDTGERLISLARVYYDELLRAYDKELWNVVVRHAQEVVELYLKGLLKIMGVEYPKSHDVGEVLSRVCAEMGLKIEPGELSELRGISSDLADKRAPAFYMEIIYNKQDADKAKAGAEKVLSFAELLAKKLENK